MNDYFGRKVEIGDTIIWQPYNTKSFGKAKVSGFTKNFGNDAIVTDFLGGRVEKGFIIIEKHSGETLEMI